MSKLPPELLRQGRFDETFFFDLPNVVERKGVLKASLVQYNRGALKINYDKVADATVDFASVEIAELVPSAMTRAYKDNKREITTDDLLAVAGKVVPLIKRSAAKVNAIREWGKANARPASAPPAEAEASTGRQIDI